MRVTITQSSDWHPKLFNPAHRLDNVLLSVEFDNTELAIIKHNGLESYVFFSGEWDYVPGKTDYYVKDLLRPKIRLYPRNKLDVRLLHDQLNVALTRLKTMINNLATDDPPSTTTFEI